MNVMVQPPLVIDIYHDDDVSDFAAVQGFGILGVIHKSSEGTADADPRYAARRKLASALGLKWGAYHFFHGLDPVAEADWFLACAAPDAATLIALDWENWPDDRHAPSATAARAFLERIEDRLARKALIYSGNVAKEQLPHDAHGNEVADPYFGAHRLWLAQYGSLWRVHASWTRPWAWQNNGDSSGPGPHRIPGIGNDCDNSTVVPPMTAADLVTQWAA